MGISGLAPEGISVVQVVQQSSLGGSEKKKNSFKFVYFLTWSLYEVEQGTFYPYIIGNSDSYILCKEDQYWMIWDHKLRREWHNYTNRIEIFQRTNQYLPLCYVIAKEGNIKILKLKPTKKQMTQQIKPSRIIITWKPMVCSSLWSPSKTRRPSKIKAGFSIFLWMRS